MRVLHPAVFPVVLACFFASGAAALAYQVTWARYLAITLGHTSYAVVAVLVAFMGGLAIGSAWLGKITDRLRRPLATYAWFEIAIALYAFAFPVAHGIAEQFYFSVASDAGGLTNLALKYILSGVLILGPTILMGATLPLLARFLTRSLSELRGRVAALYAINSFGAVFGCWAADFWWIPDYGLEVAIYGGGILNLAAGLVAFGLSRSLLEGARSAPIPQPPEPLENYTPSELKLAALAIGASGFVAMLYEVAWTRLLALALGSSTHAFSIMLMTFIGGIAVGSAVITRWRPARRGLEILAALEIALGGAVLISMFLYEPLPFWFTRVANLVVRKESAYPVYELIQGLICFAVMFVPALLLGMTLPIASRIAAAEAAATGRAVGRIFAINTTGTVLGALVTGLWFMPFFGLPQTFALGVVCNIAIGLAIFYRERLPKLAGPGYATAVAIGGLVVWFFGWVFTGPWQRAFSQGVWRYRNAATLEEFRANGRSYGIRYYKDGAAASVSINYRTNGNMMAMALRVNGKTDASAGDGATQVLLAQLPALMRTKATNALVVGLGSGMTASSLLRHTNILRADVVEIHPEVVEAAKFFSPFTDYVLENKRLRVIVDDAKSYLNTTGEKYDIITSEPSNPWMAGVASVFSQEFFASCRDRLNPGGIMVQWIHHYESDDRVLRTVIKSFATSFPFVSIWSSEAGDLLLIGTVKEQAVDLDAFLTRMRDARIIEELARANLDSPVTLLAREIVSPTNGAFLAGADDPVHSDYFPSLEYMSQRAFFVGSDAKAHEAVNETRSPRAATLLGELLKRHRMNENDLRALARVAFERQSLDQRLVYSFLHRWIEENPVTTVPFEMLERITLQRPAAVTEELRLLPRHAEMVRAAREDPNLLHFYEVVLMQAYRFKRSILYTPAARELNEVLGLLAERDSPRRRLYYLHRAELAWDRGDDAACLSFGNAALDPESGLGPPDFSSDLQAPRIVLAAMIQASLRAGDIVRAHTLARQAITGGYTNPGEFYYAPLNLACRKAQAAFDSRSAVAKTGR